MQQSTATESHDHVRKSRIHANGRRVLITRMVGTCLVICLIVLLVMVLYLVTKQTPLPYCDFREEDYVTPRDLKNPDVFDDLNPAEYDAVRSFLMTVQELNIKSGYGISVNSSYIYMIQLFIPDKAEVTEYLDRNGDKPDRVAKAIVIRGDLSPPGVEEYIVYPLPAPKKYKKYRNPSFRRYPIPYTSRPTDTADYNYLFGSFADNITEQLYPLLMESYGLCYHNCTQGKNCLVIFDVAPRAYKSGERKSWVWFFPDVEGYYIHPLGLEILIDHKSSNVDEWFIEKVVYNGQAFDSITSLMKQYHSRTLRLIQKHDHKESPTYSAYKSRTSFPDKPTQGPKFYEPEGKRFKVNGQSVKYNKWEFSFHVNPFIGLQIFNSKFGGERIAYELGLQEVLVFYSGYGPAQSVTNYYDSGWLIGVDCMELVRGVDCPETAVFIDTYTMGKTSKNSICIFENNGAIPMRRHYANNFEGGYDFYGGLTDYHLVIRTMANVWNYDYVFDYIFYNNGAIEVKASATGYVQATFGLPQEKKYGSFIHDQVMADLHLHIFNYKVDLDIAGEKNRFSTWNLGVAPFTDPWVDGKISQKMVIKKLLQNMESKTSVVDTNLLQYHLIHNSNAKNKYGAERAYRILNKAPVLNIISESDIFEAAKWSKYPIIVTKRNDTERQSSSLYAQNDPWNPVLDFEDYINGDSLVDEDLVAWVTMGTHHIPGTEDVPSTPTTWNQYSFFLTPHNYFDECPSRDSRDTVVIRPGKDRRAEVQTFGRSYKPNCVPETKGPFDFDGMRH